MNFGKDLKTVGFKDMHPEQVAAFMSLVNATLRLAEAFEDGQVFEAAHQTAEDAVVIFGGVGIELVYEPSY